ncbi:MAG: NAD(P)H-hydrate dehydratase [Acidimicrobiia bacterium]|nr:NAD(P)H-hydrate dehydratase [Acidimicrobiia bacterium]
MKPVFTAAESAAVDAAAPEPLGMYMERAGMAVATAAARMGAGYGSKVDILCGTGNNGGDGYVAAKHLVKRGAAVTVHATGFPKGEHSSSRVAAAAAVAAGVMVRHIAPPTATPDLVIDAVFGTGFHGRLPDDVAAWTSTDSPVLAVDVPSGLHADTGEVEGPVFRARRTVTFHGMKPAHLLGAGPDLCGEVDLVDIGLVGGSPVLRVCEAVDAPRPDRARQAHKWNAGSVLVVGGSPGLTGAAMLTARSALGFGAGAVTLACPGQLQPAYASLEPGVMTRAVGHGVTFAAGDVLQLLEFAGRFDVLVLGPGLGLDQQSFVAGLLEGWQGRLVLDADGLTVADPRRLDLRAAPTILTPHAGEFERLVNAPAGPENARLVAEQLDLSVLLKGSPTFVTDGAPPWVVATGGPELASIGTGDVLAGMVAALWARGLTAIEAARSAAYWHGVAGASLAERTAVTATGLSEEIGRFAS